MAITRDALKRRAQTSIHGDRLGLDDQEFIVGPKGVRHESIAATSASTSTALLNYGLSLMGMSTGAAKVYTLGLPIAGVRKELVMTSSSTKGTKITLSGASLSCTAGSSTTSITFTGRGQRAVLEGLTSATWVAVHLSGAST
jgi:hypothetical protein